MKLLRFNAMSLMSFTKASIIIKIAFKLKLLTIKKKFLFMKYDLIICYFDWSGFVYNKQNCVDCVLTKWTLLSFLYLSQKPLGRPEVLTRNDGLTRNTGEAKLPTTYLWSDKKIYLNFTSLWVFISRRFKDEF